MKRRMTFLQKVGFIVAALLPTVFLVLCLLLPLGGAVLTLSYVVTCLLLPALCILLLWRTIGGKAKNGTKWFLSILILGLSFCLFCFFSFWGHFSIYDHAKGDQAVTMYENDIGHYNLMPEITDLGSPESIEYHYFYNQIATFFDSDCYTLICAYTPEDYAAMTEALDARCTFHTEPLDAGEGELPPLYELDGYRFRFLEMDTETYDLLYPHSIILIGTNDETREIVWSYYSDDDLDYIPDPEAFLLDDCGWKFIR